MKYKAVLIVILSVISLKAEPSNLVQLDISSLFGTGKFGLGYQKNLSGRHNIGATLLIQSMRYREFESASLNLGYCFYSKKDVTFKGLWLFPQIGLCYYDRENTDVEALAGIGGRWELPLRLSIGVNLAPGICIPATKNNPFGELGFAFSSILDVAYRW